MDDIERLNRFYSSYKNDRNLALHNNEVHLQAVQSQLFFAVFRDESIVAASGVFDIDDPSYMEGGNTVVAPSVRAMGLHSYLIFARVACLLIRPQAVKLVIAVDPENKICLRGIRRNFAPLVDVPPIFFEHCDRACVKKELAELEPGRVCCCDFWVLDRSSQARLVRRHDHLLSDRGPWVVLERQGVPEGLLHVDLKQLQIPGHLAALRGLTGEI